MASVSFILCIRNKKYRPGSTNFDPVGLGETDNHFLMALFNAKDHCLKKAEGSVHNNLSYCTKNHSVYDHSAII